MGRKATFQACSRWSRAVSLFHIAMPLRSWMICAQRIAIGRAACVYVDAVPTAEAVGD